MFALFWGCKTTAPRPLGRGAGRVGPTFTRRLHAEYAPVIDGREDCATMAAVRKSSGLKRRVGVALALVTLAGALATAAPAHRDDHGSPGPAQSHQGVVQAVTPVRRPPQAARRKPGDGARRRTDEDPRRTAGRGCSATCGPATSRPRAGRPAGRRTGSRPSIPRSARAAARAAIRSPAVSNPAILTPVRHRGAARTMAVPVTTDPRDIREPLGSRPMAASVLLVEDEENLASLVEAYLTEGGLRRRRGRHRRRGAATCSRRSRSASSSST